MSTDTDILDLKSQFERAQISLAADVLTQKSFSETRSRIRKQAKDKGIDPDLVAPLDKKPAKKIEVKLETIAPSITLSTVKPLPIADITIDPAIQQRAADPGVREEYAERMRQGDSFPAIVVFFDGSTHWLSDGEQRTNAAKDSGLTEILAEIREGTRRDALLYAVGANAEHGARRTVQDKTRAVETLLRDTEWKDRTDRWIAETAKVSHPFVAKVRGSPTVKSTGNVSSQIDAPAEEAPKSTPAARQGRDGRTTNTANIGGKSSRPTKDQPPTAADAQQVKHQFMGACGDLHKVDDKLTENYAFEIALRARGTLIRLLPRLKEQDRTAMVEKVTAAAGAVGHA